MLYTRASRGEAPYAERAVTVVPSVESFAVSTIHTRPVKLVASWRICGQLANDEERPNESSAVTIY